MHFYAMTYGELLRLPISVFWALAENIDRIRADEDRRRFFVASYAFGGNADDFLQKLEDEQGRVVTINEEGPGFDRAGVDSLKNIFKGQ